MSFESICNNVSNFLMLGGGAILLLKRKKLKDLLLGSNIFKQLSIKSGLDEILAKNLNRIPTDSKFAVQTKETPEEISEQEYIFNYDEKTNYGIKVISDEDIGGNSEGELIFNGRNSSLKVKGKFQMIKRELIENRILYVGLSFNFKSKVRILITN